MAEVFIADSTDRWHWSEDVFPPLSFCVHALLRDGLRVAPFDQHPDGHGSLRALGLDADAWQRWVAALIEQRALLSLAAEALAEGRRADSRALGAGPANVLGQPASVCPGSEALRAGLDELWAEYQPTTDDWKRSVTMGDTADRRRGKPADQRQQWQALMPFHGRLPTITVFLVAYSVPVEMAVPPTTCLVAPGSDAAAYTRQVAAAVSLASAA